MKKKIEQVNTNNFKQMKLKPKKWSKYKVKQNYIHISKYLNKKKFKRTCLLKIYISL